MDKVIIHDLEVWMRVGCSEEERESPQRIEVDVEMELPLSKAGRTDDMRQTVDYSAVTHRLKERLVPSVCHLIETVAEEIAATVVGEFKVNRVTVRVRKRYLPGMAWTGVEIIRP
jgi:7,8-dihydroneopterin aldolase/epimerase/oxygenase